MSYDVSLVVDVGGDEPADLAMLNVNYTYAFDGTLRLDRAS